MPRKLILNLDAISARIEEEGRKILEVIVQEKSLKEWRESAGLEFKSYELILQTCPLHDPLGLYPPVTGLNLGEYL